MRAIALAVPVMVAACSAPPDRAGEPAQDEATNVPKGRSNARFVVPAGYVGTPFGLMHSSCLVRAAEDERVVLTEDRIEGPDGSSRPMPACEHPALDFEGHTIVLPRARGGLSQTAGQPSVDLAFPTPLMAMAGVASARNAILGFRSTFTVPNPPLQQFQSDPMPQYVALYPALELADGTLMKPAVQWSFPIDELDPAPLNQWSANTWLCCSGSGGSVAFGTSFVVEPGQSITTILNAGGQALGGTIDWTAQITGSNKTAMLTLDPGARTAALAAYGGALEFFGLSKCQELPNSSSVSFKTEVGGAGTTLDFGAQYGSTPLKSKCHFAVEAGAHLVTLSWQNRPTTAPDGGTSPSCTPPSIPVDGICLPRGFF